MAPEPHDSCGSALGMKAGLFWYSATLTAAPGPPSKVRLAELLQMGAEALDAPQMAGQGTASRGASPPSVRSRSPAGRRPAGTTHGLPSTLAERLQRGFPAERGQTSPRAGTRAWRARAGKWATEGHRRSGQGLRRPAASPRRAPRPAVRPRHRSSPRTVLGERRPRRRSPRGPRRCSAPAG